MSQAGKKMKRITTILGKVSEALNEMQHTPKPQEYAEHPKINVVTLNPTALTPQEVGGTIFFLLWRGLTWQYLGYFSMHRVVWGI